MTARLLVDGHALGLIDMGNCVVDDDGYIWVNEVTGCCGSGDSTLPVTPPRCLATVLRGFDRIQ